jgi:uncharacterized protein
MSPNISVDQQRVAQFCQENGVRRLAVFGSALRDDFGPASDIDVLVEFDAGRTPGVPARRAVALAAVAWAVG